MTSFKTRDTEEILERYWRGTGEVLERYWRGTGEVLERYWRGTGEILERYWSFYEVIAQNSDPLRLRLFHIIFDLILARFNRKTTVDQ